MPDMCHRRTAPLPVLTAHSTSPSLRWTAGNLTLLSSLSMGWLPAESVKAAYLHLAPVAFLGNMSSDFVRRAATIDFDVVAVRTAPRTESKSSLGAVLCRLSLPLPALADWILLLLLLLLLLLFSFFFFLFSFLLLVYARSGFTLLCCFCGDFLSDLQIVKDTGLHHFPFTSAWNHKTPG